jgi:hypothetical protein
MYGPELTVLSSTIGTLMSHSWSIRGLCALALRQQFGCRSNVPASWPCDSRSIGLNSSRNRNTFYHRTSNMDRYGIFIYIEI